MTKISISCDDLPVDLADAAMLAAWREHFHQKCGEYGTDIVARCDLPGKSRVAILPLKALSIVALEGKFDRIENGRAGLAGDDKDALSLAINSGPDAMRFLYHGREVLIEAGRSALFGRGMVGQFELDKRVDVSVFRLPRSSISSSHWRHDPKTAQPLPPGSEPLRMLESYARTIMAGEGVRDPSTALSIGNHLVDLIGLALGPSRDCEDSARTSSLRVGRIHAVLGIIASGYRSPAFSIHKVAVMQRVTPRYLQDLLAETGSGFSERVLELRLRDAHRMLSRPDASSRKITDIAFSAGFNDISYFTRSFRTRFGMTPSEARSKAQGSSRSRAET